MIDECAQLCKANSIEGCKLARAKIVYTPWLNLKKTAGMEDGQVGFHREQDRKYVTVEKDVRGGRGRGEEGVILCFDFEFVCGVSLLWYVT